MTHSMPRTRRPPAHIANIARELCGGPTTRRVLLERLRIDEAPAKNAIYWLRKQGFAAGSGQHQHTPATYRLTVPLTRVLEELDRIEAELRTLAKSQAERAANAKRRRLERMALGPPPWELERHWGALPQYWLIREIEADREAGLELAGVES